MVTEALVQRMTALVPYFEIPIFEWGPVVLDSWTALVLLGFVVGLEITRARAIRLGLEVKDIVDGAVVTVGMGFIVGHIVHVVAYNPHQLEEDGIMALLRVWAGFSSTGGFIGAVLGSILFYRVIRKRDYWLHADTIMFGFPFAWTFGRLGCFTAHDHIGKASDFFLAVQFPGGSRHDLGLYEAIWTAGIAALWGPSHGGANEAVVKMLEEIGSVDRIDEFVAKAKDKNDPFRLMGFGHRVYKNFDPRAKVMKQAADEVLAELGIEDENLEIAKRLEEIALQDEYFIEKKLYPNVDFYSGIILKALGIPTSMFTVIFAIGRTVGWIAHWNEMIGGAYRIGGPRQLYTGEKKRDFVPLDKR